VFHWIPFTAFLLRTIFRPFAQGFRHGFVDGVAQRKLIAAVPRKEPRIIVESDYSRERMFRGPLN